jgi:hypothetical protein
VWGPTDVIGYIHEYQSCGNGFVSSWVTSTTSMLQS